MTDTFQKEEFIHTHELEKASNAYLMAVVSVIAGLPLPIINVLASLGYYIAQRKTAYFVRWHCIQAIIAQAIMIPFNSIALWWTISKLSDAIKFKDQFFKGDNGHGHKVGFDFTPLQGTNALYWAYIAFIIFLNLIEFIAVISTSIAVRKGKNVRWFLVANITDALTSKENRDPYRI